MLWNITLSNISTALYRIGYIKSFNRIKSFLANEGNKDTSFMALLWKPKAIKPRYLQYGKPLSAIIMIMTLVMMVMRTQGLLPFNPFSSKRSFQKYELSLSLLKRMANWVLHSLTWSHSHTPVLSALWLSWPSFRSFGHRLLAHAVFSPRSFTISYNIPLYITDNFYSYFRSCLNCHFLREAFSLPVLIPQICPFHGTMYLSFLVLIWVAILHLNDFLNY